MNNRANKKKQLLLWDLDGTLLDTLDDLTLAVNAALKKYNLPLRTKEEVQTLLATVLKNWWKEQYHLVKKTQNFWILFCISKITMADIVLITPSHFPALLTFWQNLKMTAGKWGSSPIKSILLFWI